MTARIDDASLAGDLALRAGKALLAIRSGSLPASGSPASGSPASGGGAVPSARELGARGDAASHRLLAEALADVRPDDVLFSEEAPDPQRRLGASRVWIIDPLDGTREYSEPGRTDWAVHVALWEAGVLVAGAVALPARDVTYTTVVPPVVPERAPGALRLAVSRSRPPVFMQVLADALDAELVPMGSAGVKCAAVWSGDVDAYVHAGGQYEWDSAAPVAVAMAAGLHASRLDGSPLVYNQTDPLLPDLVVCRPEFSTLLLNAIAEHTTEVIHR